MEYSDHAKARMAQRRITKQDIGYCLENYDVRVPTKSGNPKYTTRLPDGSTINAILDANSIDPVLVVTVWT